MRQDDQQSAAEQTRSLKDEVDILRERSARLENAQSTIDSMRRKVEEGNELEEKNSQYIQQNMELEEVQISNTPLSNFTFWCCD